MRFLSAKRLSGKRSSRSGLTLTEVAIVMGVVSVVLTAIWVGASSVWTNYNINRMQNQVFEIVQNFRQIYATRGMTWATGSDITNTLKGPVGGDDSVYPQDVWNGSGEPRHAFGGAVKVSYYNTPAAAAPQNMRRIGVRLEGLNRGVCANFILKTPVLVRESGIVWIGGPGGNRAINLFGGSSAVSLAEATNWCNKTDNTNWVGIEFKVAN